MEWHNQHLPMSIIKEELGTQMENIDFVQNNYCMIANQNKWEWKVKVKSDGIKYVSHRPAKYHILKQREEKTDHERSFGRTTDVETAFELIFRKFWRKEEQKKHDKGKKKSEIFYINKINIKSLIYYNMCL